MDIENKIEEVEGKIIEHSLAYEIMLELKTTIRRQYIILFTVICLWAATIGGFMWYQSLWDYSSTSTYEANGIYALIDSNGNIVAQDVTKEQLDAFREWWELNGNSKENGNQNQDAQKR